MQNSIFDDIRPYYDEEVNPAIRRIIADPGFPGIIRYFFPELNIEKYIESIINISTSHDFQAQIMDKIIWAIVKKTSSGLTWSGFEQLKPEESYLFISNHRDILLDSAILQILLFYHNLDTSEISFGSNLMVSQLVIDIGKVNRMYKVQRGGSMKEFIQNSAHLSEYIRYSITQKKVSSWIAQRNGRAKDGDDKTEQGLLKMLNVSGKHDFVKNFEELKIRPIAISYEYEPCDAQKVQELYLAQSGPYIKKPGEDLNSIISGITQFKGRIHLAICNPLHDEIQNTTGEQNNNERIKKLALAMDQDIYKNYKLFPSHFIAFDILNNSDQFANNYTLEEKEKFVDYMHHRLQKLQGEKDQLEMIFLNLYANPVKNSIYG